MGTIEENKVLIRNLHNYVGKVPCKKIEDNSQVFDSFTQRLTMMSFKKSDISEHNTRKSLWFVIHNRVYDVTKFLPEHPGGEEVFLAAAGGDATECFDSIGHSEEAKSLMKQYQIGILEPALLKSYEVETNCANSCKVPVIVASTG